MAQASTPGSLPHSLPGNPFRRPTSNSHNSTPRLHLSQLKNSHNDPHPTLSTSTHPTLSTSTHPTLSTSTHSTLAATSNYSKSLIQVWVQKPRRERPGVRTRGRANCAQGDAALPTQEDIIAAAEEKGITLGIKPTGPLFVVTAIDAATGDNLGTADGFVKPWVGGSILHLDSIRLTKASATRSGRTIFGAGLYMGALMVRHGIDCGCEKAELLAINDSDEYHRKLVRYYSRLGMKAVCEVKGESWRDYAHMLVWGGVGTRMDGDLRELLRKWAATLKPASRAKATVEL